MSQVTAMSLLLLIIILCFKIYFARSSKCIFTTVPVTQYVYLNHNVSFECATNVSGYSLNIGFGPQLSNFTDSIMRTMTDLPNGGKHITATFNATSLHINGTDVTCYAIMGMTLSNSDIAYVYAQGEPDPVTNLIGYQLDPCCIYISWDPPFTLPGLSVWYSVSSQLIYTTNYTYCPIHLTNGNYQFEVIPINGAGNGLSSNISVQFETNTHLMVTYLQYLTHHINDHWTLHFTITSELCHQSIERVTLISCNVNNNSDCYTGTHDTFTISTTDINMTSIIVSMMYLPSRQMFTSYITLEYENGQIFQTTSVNISTHSLHNVLLINSSFNEICVQFEFINGSRVDEVNLKFESINMNHSISDNVSDINELIYTRCYSNIPPANNYTLYVCDGPSLDTCSTNPSTVLTNINIIGTIEPSPSSSIISSYTCRDDCDISSFTITTSQSITTTAISSTTTITTDTVTVTPAPLVIIGAIIGTLTLLIVITLLVGCILMLILVKCKKPLNLITKRQVAQSHDYIESSVILSSLPSPPTPPSPNELNVISNEFIIQEAEVQPSSVVPPLSLKYIEIGIDPNPPVVPPPMEPPSNYITIQNPESIYDKTSHVIRPSSHYMAPANNHQEYSQLTGITTNNDHRVYDECQHEMLPKLPPACKDPEYSTLHDAETSFITDDDHKELLSQRELLVHVVPHLNGKWREMGIALALTPPQLDDVEENHQGISDVFQLWEELKTRPFTWDTLLMALRSPQVNEFELANRLESTIS